VSATSRDDRNLVEKVIKTVVETLYQVRKKMPAHWQPYD
jgi:hypothetical protein